MKKTEEKEKPRLVSYATVVKQLCKIALAEDLGQDGDVTTDSIVPAHTQATAYVTTREECVFCGKDFIQQIFKSLDKHVEITFHVKDGTFCLAGTRIATVSGAARAILTGERTMLNFIQRLSGIATITHKYLRVLGKTKTKLLDTRKTTPGLRVVEKYAVNCAGGTNHRFGLFDMAMVKDNHRFVAENTRKISIKKAVELIRKKHPGIKVEVEADTMEDVQHALDAKADIIMLDNMTDFEMTEAIKLIDGKAKTEASGGITLERLPKLSKLGLDFISVGALTHSAPCIDIGLDM